MAAVQTATSQKSFTANGPSASYSAASASTVVSPVYASTVAVSASTLAG